MIWNLDQQDVIKIKITNITLNDGSHSEISSYMLWNTLICVCNVCMECDVSWVYIIMINVTVRIM